MMGQLGTKGIVGVLLVLAGLAIVAYRSPVLAAGLVVVLVGMGLVLWGAISGLMASFGLGGMMGGEWE